MVLSDSALILAHLLQRPGLESYRMLHMLCASGRGQNVLCARWTQRLKPVRGPFQVQA